ncbi:hypothetical protein [Ferrimonas balearica]|uniref:hypothetical protein n=1 Tax=Ferrimonas balearica TaxID=44012 RepID=UPI001C9910B3|nr:hypothetical protein [Ferrimonas balearica]MBY5992504.1 hypothetical protein [Ferrimonas balearica]
MKKKVAAALMVSTLSGCVMTQMEPRWVQTESYASEFDGSSWTRFRNPGAYTPQLGGGYEYTRIAVVNGEYVQIHLTRAGEYETIERLAYRIGDTVIEAKPLGITELSSVTGVSRSSTRRFGLSCDDFIDVVDAGTDIVGRVTNLRGNSRDLRHRENAMFLLEVAVQACQAQQ